MMENITQLPTAAASYYTLQKAGKWWNVVLVTPSYPKPFKTVLCRSPDRAAAIAHGEATASRMRRPFKCKGAE